MRIKIARGGRGRRVFCRSGAFDGASRAHGKGGQDLSVCFAAIFQKPNFRLTEGLSVKVGEADPMGVGLNPGENFYTDLIHNLIQSIYGCLKEIE